MKHAKKYSVAVIALLLANFGLIPLVQSFLLARPTPVSFAARCGVEWALFLWACGLVAAEGCLLSAGWLFYTVRKRGRGHGLNRITKIYAWADLLMGAAFLSSSIGLGRMSCWWPIGLFGATVGAVGVKAFFVTLDTPMLAKLPDGYKLQEQIVGLEARIKRLKEAPGELTQEEDEAAVDLLADCQGTLQEIYELLGSPQQRPAEAKV